MKWVRPAMYNTHRSIVLNKEGTQRKGFFVFMCACMYVCMYVCMLHTAASVAVPRLVTYIQAFLCPEGYDVI